MPYEERWNTQKVITQYCTKKSEVYQQMDTTVLTGSSNYTNKNLKY